MTRSLAYLWYIGFVLYLADWLRWTTNGRARFWINVLNITKGRVPR